jgi:hypothetical protein
MRGNNLRFSQNPGTRVNTQTMISTSVESSNQEPGIIEHLSSLAVRTMLAAFPAHTQQSFERRAKEIYYPIEAVLEMAITGFPDDESLSFVDCQPRY